jgi:hypothetical protein
MDASHKHTRPSSSPRYRPLEFLTFSICACPLLSVDALHHMKRAPLQYVARQEETRPLVITNMCQELIYPAIATQAGTAPSTQGFALDAGDTMNLTVGADWQGRVWGRTNCSFNSDGSGPSTAGGLNGGGQACSTGDCNGVVNCVVTVWTSTYGKSLAVLNNNLLLREIRLSHSQSSPLPPQRHRLTTIFHL